MRSPCAGWPTVLEWFKMTGERRSRLIYPWWQLYERSQQCVLPTDGTLWRRLEGIWMLRDAGRASGFEKRFPE